MFQTRYTEDIIEDLMDQRTGQTIPGRYQVQVQKIPGMDFDWSTIVNQDGDQVPTSCTHWPRSRSLTEEMRTGMNRIGLCMGCHQHMTEKELWAKVSTEGRLSDEEHIELMSKMFQAYVEKMSKE